MVLTVVRHGGAIIRLVRGLFGESLKGYGYGLPIFLDSFRRIRLPIRSNVIPLDLMRSNVISIRSNVVVRSLIGSKKLSRKIFLNFSESCRRC